jgi:hypothetical protein
MSGPGARNLVTLGVVATCKKRRFHHIRISILHSTKTTSAMAEKPEEADDENEQPEGPKLVPARTPYCPGMKCLFSSYLRCRELSCSQKMECLWSIANSIRAGNRSSRGV